MGRGAERGVCDRLRVDSRPVFTVESAQELLDATVRALAERMVERRAASRDLERRWRQVVIAVASNGGNMTKPEVESLRSELEQSHAEIRGLVDEIGGHGVQVKDIDRGLLDFPADRDGRVVLLCWMVGEDRIAHWHTEQDGFAGREPL